MILLTTLKTVIVSGQSTTQDSCICYTLRQDKNSLECFIKSEKKDAVIKKHEKVIEKAKQREDVKDEVIDTKILIIENNNIKIKKKNKDIAKAWIVAFGMSIIAILK